MSLQVWLPLNGSLENKGLSDLNFSFENNAFPFETNNYRYIKFVIHQTKSENSSDGREIVQLSVLNFLDSQGNRFAYPSGTTVISNMTHFGDESPIQIINNNVGTKFCAEYVQDGYLLIDLGAGNTIDLNIYTQFQWYTANDAEWRDPISFSMQYSNDGSTFKTLNTVSGATIPAERKVLAYTGYSQLTNGKVTSKSYYNDNGNGFLSSTKNGNLGGIISNKVLHIGDNLSMFAWVNLQDLNTSSSLTGIGGMHTISNGAGSYSNRRGMGLNVHQNGSICFSWGDGQGRFHYNNECSNQSIGLNQWHHIGFTCQKKNATTSTITLYIDGVECGAHNIDNLYNPDDYVHLFSWARDGQESTPKIYSGYKPKGRINDFRIYDHCLSPREVKLLAQGLVAHYKLEAPHLENTANIDPWRSAMTNQTLLDTGNTGIATVTYGNYYNYPSFKIVLSKNNITSWQGFYHSATPTSYGASVGDVVTRSYWMYVSQDQKNNMPFPGGQFLEGSGEIISQIKYNLDLCDTWQRISITAKVNGTNCNLLNYLVSQSSGNVNFTCYIRDFQMEIKDHPTPYTSTSREDTTNLIEYDSSGYNNHGTCSAVFKHTSDAPRYKNCKNFENNKYIDCGRNIKPTDAFTVSCWANVDWSNSNGQLISCTEGGGWGMGKGANALGSGKEGFEIYSNSDKKYYGINFNYNSLSSGWHHFVATYNGSVLQGFIDGNIVKNENSDTWPAGSDFIYPSASIGLLIGAEPGASENGRYLNGKISDVRIYATALSAAAVKELYQSSISFLDNGTLQCSEIVESPTNLKIKENGIVQVASINEVIKLSEIKIKTLSDGSLWGRIFYHKNNGGKTLFTSAAEVLHTTSTDKFSRLDWLPYFKGNHEKYEFLLTYPSLVDGTNLSNQYNRWKQTYAPQDNWLGNGDGSRNANGYEAIHIDWSGQFWGGLVRQNGTSTDITSCYIDGSSYHSNWFYAIGASESWGGGIPGPHASIGVTETELWVRLDTNIKIFNQAISVQQIYEL